MAVAVVVSLGGTLRNHDDDGNGNVKKTIGLKNEQNNNAFLYISLHSLHNYDVK